MVQFVDILAFTEKPGQSGRLQRYIPEDLNDKTLQDFDFFQLPHLRLVIRTGPNREAFQDF